jgi:phage gp45-like
MEDTDVEARQSNTAHRVFLRKTDDSGVQQLVDYDGLEGESHTEVLRINPHGIISNPGADAEGVVVALGSRDMPVFFGGEHPDKRPKDLPAWAAGFYDGSGLLVYGDGEGNVFVKKAKTLDAEVEGSAKLKAATITLEAPDINLKGRVAIDGDITQTGSITSTGAHSAAGGHI